MHDPQISEFGKVLLFLTLGTAFVLIGYLINRLISPRRPNPEKLSSYECGEEPVGDAWIHFNIRFYIVALIFLLFEVELIFIFPWATVFGESDLIAQHPYWGWITLAEMVVFVSILIAGLVFVWVKGDLDWIKPEPLIPSAVSHIPEKLYDQINQQKHSLKPFTAETKKTAADTTESSGTLASQVTRPPFKSSTIKKKE